MSRITPPPPENYSVRVGLKTSGVTFGIGALQSGEMYLMKLQTLQQNKSMKKISERRISPFLQKYCNSLIKRWAGILAGFKFSAFLSGRRKVLNRITINCKNPVALFNFFGLFIIIVFSGSAASDKLPDVALYNVFDDLFVNQIECDSQKARYHASRDSYLQNSKNWKEQLPSGAYRPTEWRDEKHLKRKDLIGEIKNLLREKRHLNAKNIKIVGKHSILELPPNDMSLIKTNRARIATINNDLQQKYQAVEEIDDALDDSTNLRTQKEDLHSHTYHQVCLKKTDQERFKNLFKSYKSVILKNITQEKCNLLADLYQRSFKYYQTNIIEPSKKIEWTEIEPGWKASAEISIAYTQPYIIDGIFDKMLSERDTYDGVCRKDKTVASEETAASDQNPAPTAAAGEQTGAEPENSSSSDSTDTVAGEKAAAYHSSRLGGRHPGATGPASAPVESRASPVIARLSAGEETVDEELAEMDRNVEAVKEQQRTGREIDESNVTSLLLQGENLVAQVNPNNVADPDAVIAKADSIIENLSKLDVTDRNKERQGLLINKLNSMKQRLEQAPRQAHSVGDRAISGGATRAGLTVAPYISKSSDPEPAEKKSSGSFLSDFFGGLWSGLSAFFSNLFSLFG